VSLDEGGGVATAPDRIMPRAQVESPTPSRIQIFRAACHRASTYAIGTKTCPVRRSPEQRETPQWWST